MVDVMNELVDQVADAGTCDVVTDIARPYPVPIIRALLGAPREDWQRFSPWADDTKPSASVSNSPQKKLVSCGRGASSTTTSMTWSLGGGTA
jgi:cytochrome P450